MLGPLLKQKRAKCWPNKSLKIQVTIFFLQFFKDFQYITLSQYCSAWGQSWTLRYVYIPPPPPTRNSKVSVYFLRNRDENQFLLKKFIEYWPDFFSKLHILIWKKPIRDCKIETNETRLRQDCLKIFIWDETKTRQLPKFHIRPIVSVPWFLRPRLSFFTDAIEWLFEICIVPAYFCFG